MKKHDRLPLVAAEQDRYAHQDSEEQHGFINIFSNPNPSFIQPNLEGLKENLFAVIKYTFMGYYALFQQTVFTDDR